MAGAAPHATRWNAPVLVAAATALVVCTAGIVPASVLVRVVAPLAAFIAADAGGRLGAAAVSLALAALAAGTAMAGDASGAGLLAAFGVGGAAAGLAARAGFGGFASVAAAAAPAALLAVGLHVTNLWGFRTGVVTSLETALTGYQNAGLLPPQVSEALPRVREAWIRLYPMLLTMAVAASAAAVYLVASVLLPLARRPALPVQRFRAWRVPDALVWVLVLGLALVVVRRAPFVTIGANLTGLMVAGYGLVGLSIVRYFLVAWGMATWLQVLVVSGSVVLGLLSQVPVILALAVTLGFLDTWLDFRRLAGPRLPAGEGRTVHR